MAKRMVAARATDCTRGREPSASVAAPPSSRSEIADPSRIAIPRVLLLVADKWPPSDIGL
jgi:hypothetical protein